MCLPATGENVFLEVRNIANVYDRNSLQVPFIYITYLAPKRIFVAVVSCP